MRPGSIMIGLPIAQAVALAQPLPGPAQENDAEDIVVTATRLDPQQFRQRAVEFVARTGVANRQLQVARWIVPVCIKVLGVTDPQATKVKNVMHGIARQVDVPIAEAGCRTNVTVTFASDARLIVRHVYARQPQQLRRLSPSKREQLLNGMEPVRWWYASRNLDRNGVQSNGSTVHFVAPGGEEHISTLPTSDGATITQQHNGGSNIQTPTVRSLSSVNVVVDAGRADETPITSIAAYLAMIAFAEIDAATPPSDSILGLFQSNGRRLFLTDWDLGFLKSLYRLPLDRRSRIQRGHLVNGLLRERLSKGN